MTAIICIRKPNSVDVITDGACTDAVTGVLRMVASKVGLLATAPAILAGRGNHSLVHAITGSCAGSGWSFDEMIQHIPPLARKFSAVLPPDLNDEIKLAGFSASQDRFMVLLMPCSDHLAQFGMKAFELTEQREPFTAAPKPSLKAEAEVGFTFPGHFDDFDPETHGRKLLEAMRRTPEFTHSIGGVVQVSTVTRDGVSSKVVHCWPDKIGERISL